MKKIKFISALALTMALVSCDNFDLPNPPGQSYDEPIGIFTGADLELASPETQILNLVEANKANENVVVAKIAKLENFPTDYTLNIEMEVAADDQFKKVSTIETVIEDTLEGDKVVTANPDFLNAAIQEVLTKHPGQYDIVVRFVAYAVNGTTKLRLGSPTTTYLTEGLSVRTLDPTKVLDMKYYLVPCDANGAPQFAKGIQMDNTSGNNVSTYDNPEFAIKFEIPEAEAVAGYRFMIFGEAAYAAKDATQGLGCNPAADGISGVLVAGGKPGVIRNMIGDVQVIINVSEDTYQVTYALEVIWPLSGTTLTKPDQAMLLYTTNYINYSGVTYLGSQYYLCGQPDYKGAIAFRQSDEEPFEDSEDGLTRSGKLTAVGGTQLKTPKGANLYWVDVNLLQMTYSVTALETMSLVGEHNSWNEKAEEVDGKAPAVALTHAKNAYNVWTAKDVELGGEFKVNCNYAWAEDFGGTAVPDVDGKKVFNLVHKGGNLSIEKGKYDITIDFSTLPYTMTCVKK
ncbi:MAG: hypothetical protein K2M87_00830 [Muribaculaceae bacterium]|nr:hypothetical protein [Muribaculaceae bacterium]